jgi:hypothetical protein
MSTPLWASVLIAHALLLNIQIFCIAEALILVFALAIAVLRGLPGRVLFPRTQQLLERIIAAGRL